MKRKAITFTKPEIEILKLYLSDNPFDWTNEEWELLRTIEEKVNEASNSLNKAKL